MRNAILSGLTVALGFVTNPVLGQDTRTTTTPVRAARLGYPVAAADAAAANQTVTPIGLLMPDPDFSQVPAPMPTPPGGMPVPVVPMTPTAPIGTQLPAPKPVPPAGTNPTPGAPSVTEVRVPDGVPAPTVVPGFPTIVPGYQVNPTYPATVVPGPPYGEYPPVGLEQQLGNDSGVGVPAVERVSSCNRWYASAEYLMWWTRSMQVPTLLTTSAPRRFRYPRSAHNHCVVWRRCRQHFPWWRSIHNRGLVRQV